MNKGLSMQKEGENGILPVSSLVSSSPTRISINETSVSHLKSSAIERSPNPPSTGISHRSNITRKHLPDSSNTHLWEGILEPHVGFGKSTGEWTGEDTIGKEGVTGEEAVGNWSISSSVKGTAPKNSVLVLRRVQVVGEL